jgi:hypothetical protein
MPFVFVPVAHEVPLIVSEPVVVVIIAEFTKMPRPEFDPFLAVPVIVTLPVPVAEMLADGARKTPPEPIPVPHEVPLTVSEPVLDVIVAAFIWMPLGLSVAPVAAVPVIVTVPAPVAEITVDEFRYTPLENGPVLHEVPLILSVPDVVVTVAPDARMPLA